MFFAEEWAAAAHRFVDGVALADVIEGFAASIDTAAWVVLLLMFELETYVLDDKQITRRVELALHGLRAISYAIIIYAFYGYVSKLSYVLGSTPLNSITDLCALADSGWSYAIDFDEYENLTAINCGQLSQAAVFMKFSGINAVVDNGGFVDIVRLAWTDVINAAVWLLVVLVLEFDVRLQEKNMLHGSALKFSTVAKYLLYSVLFLAAVYWGIKGDFVDFWDAFLWLVAFIFIELNVFEWRQEPENPVSQAAHK